MGTAPGIKAEFYEQANMDFCADLKNWTTLLLSDSDSPKVWHIPGFFFFFPFSVFFLCCEVRSS
jgi:hypothetical protein